MIGTNSEVVVCKLVFSMGLKERREQIVANFWCLRSSLFPKRNPGSLTLREMPSLPCPLMLHIHTFKSNCIKPPLCTNEWYEYTYIWVCTLLFCWMFRHLKTSFWLGRDYWPPGKSVLRDSKIFLARIHILPSPELKHPPETCSSALILPAPGPGKYRPCSTKLAKAIQTSQS